MVKQVHRALVLATVLTAASSAFADAADDEAAALYGEAKELATQGKWPEACAKLEKSSAVRARMTTTYRLAECYEHVGRLIDSQRKYEEAAKAADAAGELGKRDEAIAWAKKLEGRIGQITVNAAEHPAGLVVELDGVAVADGKPNKVDPGEHRVRATAPGRKPFAKTLTVADSARLTIDVPALESDAPTAPETPVAPPPTTQPSSSSPLRTVGLVAGGVGIATLVVGTFVGLSAKSRYAEGDDHCPGGLCDREGLAASESGRSRAQTATILLVGGGVLVGAGVTLFLVSPSSSERPSPSVALSLSPSGAFAVGRF
jgi:hypothetical protein